MKVTSLIVIFTLLFVGIVVGVYSPDRIEAPSKEFRKQLAGPPSEFSEYLPPSPSSISQVSEGAFIPVTLQQTQIENGNNVWQWKSVFPVDSVLKFSISVFSLQPEKLQIFVQPPNWPLTLLDDHIFTTPGARGQKIVNDFGIGATKMPVTTFVWPEPEQGEWLIIVRSTDDIMHKSGQPQVYLLFGNESPLKIATHLNTYDLQVGQEVGLVARVFDTSSNPNAKDLVSELTPLQGVVFTAEMDVVLPDGKELVFPMHDDGLSSDLAANDGVYGAVLEAVEEGEYIVTAIINGHTPEGVNFVRTTVHTFNVLSPKVTLTGLGSAAFVEDKNILQFYIDTDTLIPNDAVRVQAYAEVWGTDQSGLEYVPVAWIMSMVDVENSEGKQRLTMDLHKNWIQLAQAKAPFQLRNVRIQDPDTNFPYSTRSAIYIQMEETVINSLAAHLDYSVKPEITEEMLVGPRPKSLRQPILSDSSDNQDNSGTLLLVHGYCATINEFPTDQFTNAVQYTDLKASRSNDQFALRIREFGSPYPSFSTVAHSQGGLASLHLKTYYWSGLDATTTGGRKIQSVGSPYQGTSLAGSLADLGAIFGIGCGGNVDLSRDGASNWLKGIPVSARSEVYYYTTQYDDYWWVLSNNCVTAGNVVLAKPNDGTTEQSYGQLSGGNNAGHKKAWCHTTGMKYPNQCTDSTRNAEMNQLAAR